MPVQHLVKSVETRNCFIVSRYVGSLSGGSSIEKLAHVESHGYRRIEHAYLQFNFFNTVNRAVADGFFPSSILRFLRWTVKCLSFCLFLKAVFS